MTDTIKELIARVKNQIRIEDQTRTSKRGALTTGDFYLGDIEALLADNERLRGALEEILTIAADADDDVIAELANQALKDSALAREVD